MKPSVFHPSRLDAPFESGIIHIGLGAFHRAHQAVYTQKAMQRSGGNWGIEAVSMRSTDLCDAINRQQGRYTVIERHSDKNTLCEISAIKRAHALVREPQAVVQLFTVLSITTVTITITEKGYGFDPLTRRLNRTSPHIIHDLANPNVPQTAIGLLVAGLSARRDAGLNGMTLLSCDNLTKNGDLLRGLVLEFAHLVDDKVATWIDSKCSFPTSMVDRITPASTQATYDLVQKVTEKRDEAAVETEPFSQWVIEDNFAGPVPDWQQAGALYVSDVAPFETMKLRMLNGAHTLIALLGLLRDRPFVRDVIADAELREIVHTHMMAAASTLKPIDGFSYQSYAKELLDRFANPAIDHQCLQIASDTSQKLPQRIFEPAAILLKNGESVVTYALCIAAWHQALLGKSLYGKPINLSDPLLNQLVKDAQNGLRAFVSKTGLDHRGVLDDEKFLKEVSAARETLS